MPLPASRNRFVLLSLLAATAFAATPALAQALPAPFELPWTDQLPALTDAEIRTAAVGMPDPRIGRFAARRASARTAGRRRALDALHAWADDALARVRATPREATAVHAAIDQHARVAGVRPLVDAGAVVVVVVPRDTLRAASGREGLPW